MLYGLWSVKVYFCNKRRFIKSRPLLIVAGFSFGSIYIYSSFLWSRIKVDLCPFMWLFLLLLWKPIHFPDLALHEKLVLGSTHLKCTKEFFFFSFCESKILGSMYLLQSKDIWKIKYLLLFSWPWIYYTKKEWH